MREQRFVAVGEQLLLAGVAPRHARRIVFELEGHMDDLLEELQGHNLTATEAEAEAFRRLRAEAVVEAARQRPELQSWMRRWPAAAFMVLPLLAYAALFVGSIAVVVLGVTLAKGAGFPVEGSYFLQQGVRAIMSGIELALPASVAMLFCLMASSRRAPLVWALLGAALISLLGATTNAQLDVPPLAKQAALTAGLGFNTDALGAPLLRASCSFLIVVLPYVALTRLQRRTA